jgi:hypothetical protein
MLGIRLSVASPDINVTCPPVLSVSFSLALPLFNIFILVNRADLDAAVPDSITDRTDLQTKPVLLYLELLVILIPPPPGQFLILKPNRCMLRCSLPDMVSRVILFQNAPHVDCCIQRGCVESIGA